MVAVIDLGERTVVDLEPSRPVDWRRLRRVILAALTVALVFLAGGSTWPLTHGPHILWTTLIGAGQLPATLDDTTLYLPADGSLTAFDLATGAVRWRAPVDGDVSMVLPPGHPATMLVMAGFTEGRHWVDADGSVFATYFSHDTYALDTATGRQLWKVEGEFGDLEHDTVLVSERDKEGGLLGLRSVRLREGTTVWRVPLTPDSVWAAVPSGQIVTVGADGVATRRGADGAVRGGGRIALPKGGTLFALGDRLAGQSSIGDAALTVTVYDPATLAESWHTRGQVTDCGPVVCVIEGSGLTAREPATGAVLWRLADVVEVEAAGAGRLLVDLGPQAGLGWTKGPYQLVDARTGRRWAQPVSGMLPQSDAPALLLRDSGTDRQSSSVSRLDPGTGRWSGLGTVARPIDGTCAARGDYLACDSIPLLIVTGLS